MKQATAANTYNFFSTQNNVSALSRPLILIGEKVLNLNF